MSENLFTVEFHFPYDKVTASKVTEEGVKKISDLMEYTGTFKVAIKDYYGKDTEGFEIINPTMVTHVRVTADTPF